MPELPEIEIVKERLKEKIIGEIVKDVKLLKPYILKSVKPHYNKLLGKILNDVQRIGKWIIFSFDEDINLFYHPKLSGYLRLKEVISRDTSFIISFGKTNLLFNETGNKKISEIYIFEGKEDFFKLKKIGIDPLSQDFTKEYIKEKLKKEKRVLYRILIDQSIFPGIGRAYMNEILFEARLSPFKKGFEINDEEISRFYESIKNVLNNAIDEIKKIDEGIEFREKRDFLKIFGKECPFCSSEIKNVFLKDITIYYCPNCQTGGKIYKDRRFSLFLK
uniref:DNA-(apurinic or apyrimidinic site) lyase n=1 Tax=candidate division WOR-3 bacterium TaxID=2052148 RepID=A0A7C4UG58_UNCW3